MFVTSTAKVVSPSTAEVVMLDLDDGLDLSELGAGQPNVPGKLDLGLQPEVCLPVAAGTMHMHPRPFPQEEVEACGRPPVRSRIYQEFTDEDGPSW
jgi:hypothetical protein